MKVSIIIPFHKGISFLEECLQSLIEQSYEDIEVILVCDHIDEDVESFISPIKAIQSIKILELKDKTGVTAARNLGVSNASGEHIYFLGSDDYIGASTLKLLVKEAKETNCDLVYGNNIVTWSKRSIFIKNFATTENGNEEEDEKESDSFDSEEPNQKSQKKEHESIKNTPKKLENQGTLSQTQLKKKAAYDFLIANKKGVRDISVLNFWFTLRILFGSKQILCIQ